MYLTGLFGTFLAFMPWVMMRFYFDELVVEPAFGRGAGAHQAIVAALILAVLGFVTRALYSITNSTIELGLTLAGAAGSVLGYLKPEFVVTFFGLEQGPGAWFLWLVFLVWVVFLAS